MEVGLAEKEEGITKTHLQQHAARWYRRALSKLTGVVKRRVEQRLSVVERKDGQHRSELRPKPVPRAGKKIILTLRRGVTMELVLIPAGSFMMGDADGRTDERPVHKVTISKPFCLGKYEVTQRQWWAVMGNNPSRVKGPMNPVEKVNWHDCQAFIGRLNRKFGGFSLPTEAQWEYACRAGSTTRFSFGDDEDRLGDYGWCGNNSARKTHPVGQRKPNAWGLYDMHGNVYEWCADWYGGDFFKEQPAVDPPGPPTGAARVFRGGAWHLIDLFHFTCASRSSPVVHSLRPDGRYPYHGFRVARTLKPCLLTRIRG